MKTIFVCDLDNTLLYSCKHKQPNDVCVEINKGKEQGFMSLKTCSLLKELAEKIDIIPVTTRSIEQYNRLDWSFSVKPQYAITTNGGVMLCDSKIDTDWLALSKEYSSRFYVEMNDLKTYFSEHNKFIRCRLVDEMYLFAYCKDAIDVDECVKEYKEITTLDVIASGKKIYFFPQKINKGTAVTRLKERLNADIIICAGDSKIDVPMLEIADYAIVPSRYLAQHITNNKTYICNEIFSETLLQFIIEKMI